MTYKTATSIGGESGGDDDDLPTDSRFEQADDPSSKKKSVSLGNDSEGVSTVQAVQTSTKAKEGASEGGEKMIKDDKELVSV